MYGANSKLTGLILLVFLTACSSSSGGGSGGSNNDGNTNKGDTDAPAISVSDSVFPSADFQVPFGSITANSTLEKTVTITNDGTADLVLETIGSALAEPFSISTDNCSGQTLAPAASCQLTVQFAPTTAGKFDDTFEIPSNDPASNPVTISVSGTGSPNPVPSIAVTDTVAPNNDHLVTFGSVSVNATVVETVTVTNEGLRDLVVGTVGNVDALVAPFSISNDTCSGQTISPGTICTITVQFSPGASGAFADSFDIPSDDPDNPSITVTVNGSGEAVAVPDITVADTVFPNNDQQVPFGSVTVNNSLDSTVTITNIGTADLVLGTLANSDPLTAPFSITTDNCSGQALSPAASCNITVHFAPTSAGTFNDSFDIPSNDPDEASVTISVNGTGNSVAVPDITVADSVAPNSDYQVPFGNVTTNTIIDETVTISNSGTATLTLGNIGSSNPLAAPFSIINDNCSGQSLAPAASCTLTVHFAPTTTSTFTDSFDIPSDDPDQASVTINVSGNTVPVPDITVSDSVLPSSDLQIPFGSVAANNTVDETVTISNSGTAALTLGNIGSSNPLAAPFSIINDNCSGQSLAPAASCTLTVHFAPTTTSAFIDSFDIPSDDPDEPSVTVNVSSTGDTTVPDILVTDGFDPATDLQLTFLTTTMGGTANGSIAIYNNSGTANLLIGTIGGVNGLSAPFSIQNDGCSNQSLVPHGICTVSLQFAPTTAGTFNDSFDIPSNDPDESTVTFNVSGTSNP